MDVAAHEVVFEFQFVVVRFDDVADRHDADEFAAANDRQMADSRDQAPRFRRISRTAATNGRGLFSIVLIE